LKNTIDHEQRIHQVIRFIEQHYTEELPLSVLAEKANYSSFHFQRIFKTIVGETPKQHINRLRLEGASHYIVLTPNTTIIEVAFMFGFTSLEAFSRAFKNYYRVSPDKFKRSNDEERLLIIQEKTKSEAQKNIDPASFLREHLQDLSAEQDVAVVKHYVKNVIYIQGTLKDEETILAAHDRIRQWAEARDLIKKDTEYFGLMRDYPLFTSLDKCRYYACVTVESRPPLSDEINFLEMPAGTYATFTVRGGINELIKSVTRFAHHWLPESGYEIQHIPAILHPVNNIISRPLHDNTYQFYLGIKPK